MKYLLIVLFNLGYRPGGSPILENKAKEMEAYTKKLGEGEIDANIINILSIINSSPDYYTTSSCAGRIQLIALPKLGDKVGSNVIGKWHDPVDLEELKKAVGDWNGNDMLMLLVQSPVIHIVCSDLSAASHLRNIGNESGFKYSTIRSIQTNSSDNNALENIVVEILSTERLDIPLGQDGTLFPDDEYMHFIHELALKGLKRSRDKLVRLEDNLKTKLNP